MGVSIAPMVDQGATPATMGHVDHTEQQFCAGFGRKVGCGFNGVGGVICAVNRAKDGMGHGMCPFWFGLLRRCAQFAQKTGKTP